MNVPIIIILSLLCLGACKSKQSAPESVNLPVVIDVDKSLGHRGELNLSDFVDSISFIPIYDGNSAWIGDARRMDMTRNYILVCDMSDRLVCYNLKNRKSKIIGLRGRGPKEYLRIKEITSSETKNIIYTLVYSSAGPSIFKYDFEGLFQGAIPLDEDADKIGMTDEGNIVVHFTNYAGTGKNQYLVMNDRGEIITAYPNRFLYRLSSERHTWFDESARYSYDGKFHVKDKSDTLYVFCEKERRPKYIFKNSYSIDGGKALSQTGYDSAFVLNYVFETDTKLVFNGRLGGSAHGKRLYFYYDKVTGQTYSIDRDIKNDPAKGFPDVFRQVASDTTFDGCYVKLIANTHLTVAGYPKDEDASYFLALFHL